MRITIGKKLNTLLIGLQCLSIGGVVVMATRLFTSDLEGLLRKGTLDVSAMLAGRVRSEMKHVYNRVRTLGAASLESFQYDEDRLKFIQDNLAIDSQYIGLGLYRWEQPEAAAPGAPTPAGSYLPAWRILNSDYARKLALGSEDFRKLDEKHPLDFASVGKGNVDFTVAKLKDGTPSLRMAVPFVQRADGTFSQLLAVELHQERLTALFAESSDYGSYLVDRTGRILGSTDPARFPLGENVSALPIFKAMAAGKSQSGQPPDFADRSGEVMMGAYHRVGFADLAVITQVPLARALLAQQQVLRRTAFLAGAFLFLALCLGFVFSQSITGPVQALAAAASRVAQGDFKVRLKVKKGGGDEIQAFSATFNDMVFGLEERDRVKATFAKFHSKEMVEKVLSGQLKLGGERKFAAVFFSDVRGFTAMSEGMDPEALVKVLNRYMTRMVRVILDHGGIVDKYVGDAIMAVWGVPFSKPDDCERAVRACLGMRVALAELNAELLAEKLPLLKIGMGLNYGPLIAGNIGSEERMEYTVIGDTVNTASRIESITKEFGTDCLISKEVLEFVMGRFVVEKAHEAKVKGKTEPLTVYKVLGYVKDGKDVLVETPYSSYTAEKSDKVVHDDKHPAPAEKQLEKPVAAAPEAVATPAATRAPVPPPMRVTTAPAPVSVPVPAPVPTTVSAAAQPVPARTPAPVPEFIPSPVAAHVEPPAAHTLAVPAAPVAAIEPAPIPAPAPAPAPAHPEGNGSAGEPATADSVPLWRRLREARARKKAARKAGALKVPPGDSGEAA
jgi:adenylate cyclase